MAGCGAHCLHVGNQGADVLRGDVGTAEAVDGLAESLEQRAAVEFVGRAQDDGLAAAEGQAGQCVLVGHAGGEPHRVGRRVVPIGIRPEAATARCGSKGCRMQHHDRLEPGCRVFEETYLLRRSDAGNDGHRKPPS
jgi:hypothetical protein